MITTTMKCDKCGLEFASMYYSGGYIDHVNNFVGNADMHLAEGDAARLAEHIMIDGNKIIEIRIIRTRLNCFKKWGAPKELEERVVSLVERGMALVEADKKAIEKCTKELTDAQKGLLYQLCDSGYLGSFSGAHVCKFYNDQGDFQVPEV